MNTAKYSTNRCRKVTLHVMRFTKKRIRGAYVFYKSNDWQFLRECDVMDHFDINRRYVQ